MRCKRVRDVLLSPNTQIIVGGTYENKMTVTYAQSQSSRKRGVVRGPMCDTDEGPGSPDSTIVEDAFSGSAPPEGFRGSAARSAVYLQGQLPAVVF